MAYTTMTPGISADTQSIKAQLVAFFTAGAAAFIAFDLFGQVLSPMFGFATLAPVGLANATISAVFGSGYRPGAEALHFFAGLVAYPLGWLMIAEPIRAKITPFVPSMAAAAIYGVGLWIFALYFMAHLVAGNAPFLGFTGITWVALVGHVLFAMVFAGVWNGMRSKD
ncbi:MAG: hypothetical protein AAFQ05_12245 [Pseudomonadota bacterium]